MSVQRITRIVVSSDLHNEREYGSLTVDPDGLDTVTLSLDTSVGPYIPGERKPERSSAHARKFSLDEIEEACKLARKMAVEQGYTP